MCGRFNVIDNPGLQDLLRELGIDLSLPPAINLAPTESAGLVRHTAAGPQLDAARWWLTPSWAPRVDQKYSMFNARSETLASSRAFRSPFARQRGIVPMSSFIEWRVEDGVKQPWLISTEDQALAAAALWDVWDGADGPLLSFTIVTTAAVSAFQPWHKRMPVLLDVTERERWMDNSERIDAQDTLFRPELKAPLHLVRLDRAVSNARNKETQLLSGVGATVRLFS
ncbi:MAG: putative SOS response-associated peptidase YedK [Bacteroidia bacterium]|jgi:putative SOS response-associated peptidase YedK